MANENFPLYTDGQAVTATVEAAVTGKRLVKTSGPVDSTTGNMIVSPCGAGEWPAGSASRDAAAGADVTIFRPYHGPVWVTAAANLSDGAAVKSDASGRLVAAAAGDLAVGHVIGDVTSGNDALLDFTPFSVPA